MKNKFTAEIALGNETMQSAQDVAEVLRGIAYRLENGNVMDGNVYDTNGNRVGTWALEIHD